MIRAAARALGVDPDAWRVLHRLFAAVSDRAGSALVARRADAKASSRRAVYLSYGTIGLLSTVGLWLAPSRDAFATQTTTTALVLLALAVIGDFASVVVAPGDDEILFPLPLSSRTYLAARLTVAATYVAKMAAALGLAPCVAAGLVFGDVPYALALFAGHLGTGLFALVVSFVLYRGALVLFGGERLKSLLAFLPAFVTLLVTLGPQFLAPPRVRVDAPRPNPLEELGAWAVALPSAWFAAPAALAAGVAPSPTLLARAGLGLASLPVGALLLVRALGGGFLEDLIRLVGAKDVGGAAGGALRPLAPGPLARRVFALSTPEARAGWRLGVGAFRSRELRARAIAFLLMPIAFTLLGLVRDGGSALTGPWFGLFFLGASGGTLVSVLPYHEHRDAGWLHEALPFRRYGAWHLGVVKAALARYLAPWMLLVVGVAIATDPTPVGVGLAFHVAAGSLYAIPIALTDEQEPPFSAAFTNEGAGGRLVRWLLSLLALGVAAGVGFLLARHAPAALAVSGPALFVGFLLWTRAIGRRLDRFPPKGVRAVA